MDLKKFWSDACNRHFNVPENDLHIEVLDDLYYWSKDTFRNPFSLLDIGQGNGRLLKRFEGKLPVTITMVDFSEKGRDLAKENTGILPDKWDGLTLPYEDNSFDLVVLFEVLLHVDPIVINQVLSEVKRVSKKYVFATGINFPKDSSFCFSHDYGSLFVGANTKSIVTYAGKKKGFYLRAYYLEVK